MKTKFTLLVTIGLLASVATMAQGRDYRNDDRDNGYKNDNRFDNHYNFDYRSRMFELQQQLNHEFNELDHARDCGDWEKARHEKREISAIRSKIKDLQRRRYFDRDDYRSHDFH
ncbi:MAG TPA: hypothetical protein VMT76_17705 [Puia sp.]|nr:hypothetical protein [Puia sp.]